MDVEAQQDPTNMRRHADNIVDLLLTCLLCRSTSAMSLGQMSQHTRTQRGGASHTPTSHVAAALRCTSASLPAHPAALVWTLFLTHNTPPHTTSTSRTFLPCSTTGCHGARATGSFGRTCHAVAAPQSPSACRPARPAALMQTLSKLYSSTTNTHAPAMSQQSCDVP